MEEIDNLDILALQENIENMLCLLASELSLEKSWPFEKIAELRKRDWIPPSTKEDIGGNEYSQDTKEPLPFNIEYGDIFLLDNGKHRLLYGDCRDKELVAKLMKGNKAALLCTDPPYGVDFKKQKYNPNTKDWDAIQNDNIQGEDLTLFLKEVLSVWASSILVNAAYYFWTAAMREGYMMYNAIIESGLHIQSQIIWVKNNHALGQSDYHWAHENCWYAFKKGTKHRWFAGRDKISTWFIDRLHGGNYLHPMQKPTEIYVIPMRHHTREGDIVAEPFAGSGTQFIAAHKIGRRCFGCEIDPVYVDVILKRCMSEGISVEKEIS